MLDKLISIAIVVISMITIIVSADAGAGTLTNLEIVSQIDSKIQAHSDATRQVMLIMSGVLSLIAGWIFKLLLDTRKQIIDIEEQTQKDYRKLSEKMGENCAHVDKKINDTQLHVANNYTKDSKIDTMIIQAMKPVEQRVTEVGAQMGVIQESLNILIARERHDKN